MTREYSSKRGSKQLKISTEKVHNIIKKSEFFTEYLLVIVKRK